LKGHWLREGGEGGAPGRTVALYSGGPRFSVVRLMLVIMDLSRRITLIQIIYGIFCSAGRMSAFRGFS